jgi:hypothetical protein
LALPASVQARPSYFDTFTAHYGIGPADNLHACGVCHYNWEGTGPRNPFGQEVEQQLYIGKTITQSLIDIEGVDSDLDGFSNGDEITIHMTLPGYACSNFQDALDAPLGYDTFITPLVASCLEPLDIRVTPLTAGFATKVGDTDTVSITVYNNGTDFALDVDSYGLVSASNADLSLAGPAAPLSIPIGGSITIDVVFAPTAPAFVNDTLRIESSDPDEDPVDVAISGFATQQVLAAAEKREACLKSAFKAYRRYVKTHLRAWNRCYADEVAGVACDGGARDLKVAKAAAKLRKGLGGTKDKLCAGENLVPSLLGLPATCGGACNEIELGSMSQYADCLVCREETARNDELSLALGTFPPDLPTSLAGSEQAAECQENLLAATQNGIDHTLRALGNCEIDNITALTPADCPTVLAEDLLAIQIRVDEAPDACEDTSGLEGCLFDPMPDPSCLGTGAVGIGSALTDAVFDTD